MRVWQCPSRRSTSRLQTSTPSSSSWSAWVSLGLTCLIHSTLLTSLVGHLVDIVNRVFSSLDLNPLLINTLGNATSLVNGVVDGVVSAVDGLLGSITQGGKTLNFIVDSLGNIVQQVDGGASTIVGNYLQNMTTTGAAENLGNGLTKQTYSYSPLNSLVDIVTNTAGQVVQAVVQKKNGSSSGSASSTSAASSSATST